MAELKNADLIGKHFKNGEDGVIRYRVTEIDPENPSIVAIENTITKQRGHALATFVRPYLLD